MKVGRIKDPLYKDSYFGITSPAFILPFEAPGIRALRYEAAGAFTTWTKSASAPPVAGSGV